MQEAYGLPDYFNDMAGNCRLSPRAISNIVVAQDDDLPSPRGLSSLVFTLNEILGKQFSVLRDGDYYYYQNNPAFSGQQKNQISNTSLRDIIERNTNIHNLQNNVFFSEICQVGNRGGSGGVDRGKVYEEAAFVNGKTLNSKIDLSELSSGVYFVSIQSGEEVISKKIVIV